MVIIINKIKNNWINWNESKGNIITTMVLIIVDVIRTNGIPIRVITNIYITITTIMTIRIKWK